MKSLGLALGHLWVDPDVIRAELDTHRHIGTLIGSSGLDDGRDDVDNGTACDGKTLDQRGAESCEGESIRGSWFCNAHALGYAGIELPSSKGPWDNARLIDSPGKTLLQIGNVGTYGRSIIQAVQQDGFVAEHRYPLNPSDEELQRWLAHLPPEERTQERWLLEPPPVDVYEHGIGAELKDYRAIPGGDAAAAAILKTLQRGLTIQYAQRVDATYAAWKPEQGVWGGCGLGESGGHAQFIRGYKRGAALEKLLAEYGGKMPKSGCALKVQGSWGPNLGIDGCVYVDVDFFKGRYEDVGDFLVMLAGPRAVT